MIRGLKFFSGLLLLAIIALFVKQNIPTFSTELPFYLDLHIREKLVWYYTIGGLVLTGFILGFLIGFFFGFKMYWRKRKEYNRLKQTAESALQQDKIIPEQSSEKSAPGGNARET